MATYYYVALSGGYPPAVEHIWRDPGMLISLLRPVYIWASDDQTRKLIDRANAEAALAFGRDLTVTLLGDSTSFRYLQRIVVED